MTTVAKMWLTSVANLALNNAHASFVCIPWIVLRFHFQWLLSPVYFHHLVKVLLGHTEMSFKICRSDHFRNLRRQQLSWTKEYSNAAKAVVNTHDYSSTWHPLLRAFSWFKSDFHESARKIASSQRMLSLRVNTKKILNGLCLIRKTRCFMTRWCQCLFKRSTRKTIESV